ncbi:MAG TPA: helix-turn-helix domain-containing protein [Steroidobacteraceae bacterium]|jgi:hypothetical protein
MPEVDSLYQHAERIRSSDLFGRSDQLQRLFDYLVECSRSGKIPKESVIAVEVFGRGTDFDVSQDAAVRVYIHKLRRKFEEFYAAHPELGTARLSIPKGEYRLVLEDKYVPPVAEPAANTEPPAPPRNPWKIAALATAAALIVVAIGAGALWLRSPAQQYAAIRNSPAWAKLLEDSRPITLVLGDYYIFAENGELSQPERLVREFFINSRADLDQYLMDHPELMDRYTDVQLGYLPTSSAHVMADIMPLLASTHRRVNVTMMSDLAPEDLKRTDVIYVGYLSGLGMLYDGAFSGSRFSVGSTFDELTDKKTKVRYVSQAGDRYLMQPDRPNSATAGQMYRDYSLITSFQGPSGNQVLVIAGTRDVGLIQAGGAVTDPNALSELRGRLTPGTPFEALYEVSGINGTEMASKLLVTAPRPLHNSWDHVPLEPDRLDTVALANRP